MRHADLDSRVIDHRNEAVVQLHPGLCKSERLVYGKKNDTTSKTCDLEQAVFFFPNLSVLGYITGTVRVS